MMMWVYLVAIGAAIVLAVAACVWWYARRRRGREVAGTLEMSESLASTTETIRRESFASTGSMETPVEAAEDPPTTGSRETPVPSEQSERQPVSLTTPSTMKESGESRDAEHVRICPECDRSFPANYVVCPFDSTALQTIGRRAGQTEPNTEVGSGHSRCPTCDRRYYPGQSYCYRDGSALVAESDNRTPTTGDEAWRVCPECGREARTDARLCPEDGTELMRVGKPRSGHGRTTPPVPMMRCPECGGSAAPGTARCPEDGTLLTPIQNETLDQFPPTGVGPRRKVCPECGERYSRAARYCSNDGTELAERN